MLRLYVTGATPRSGRAIANIRKICHQHLRGRYNLQVVDIYQQGRLAADEQIIAAPTLIKKLPLPLRRFVGDLSNQDRVLLGLDLRSHKVEAKTGTAGRAGVATKARISGRGAKRRAVGRKGRTGKPRSK